MFTEKIVIWWGNDSNNDKSGELEYSVEHQKNKVGIIVLEPTEASIHGWILDRALVSPEVLGRPLVVKSTQLLCCFGQLPFESMFASQ